MGAYLSEPVTKKISKDEDSDRLSYGASSMQGWRVSQEDSHNCIIDFDTDTSLFAVYDGHGGAEVAVYCSMNLPDCLRSTADYKKGNFNQALENAFLEFDTSLTKPEVILELKQIAGLPDSDDDSVEDASALREEASLPLDEVLARYGTTAIKKVAPHVTSDYEKPKSPMLRGKNRTVLPDHNGLPGTSKTLGTSSAELQPVNGEVDVKEEETDTAPTTKDSSRTVDNSSEEQNVGKTEDDTVSKTEDCSKSDLMQQPGCSTEVDSSSSSSSSRRKRSKKGDYTVTQKSSSDEEDDSEEDDKEYSAKRESSSEEEEGEEEEKNDEGNEQKLKKEGGEENDDEEDEESEDEESEEEEEESDSSDDESNMGGMGRANSEEEPGADSGCTAVVALLKENKLYVANAGDSRCVVSKNGQAVNLSFDHKPEDTIESDRIVKAGGKVTQDGRVNGGLNLSRAIGDHAYKCNEALSAKEQMITAFPDIQTLDIDTKEYDFMVLACDGIWNAMSSQEVIDFVSERIKDCDKLSSICEELLNDCLAPDTRGDGTGCDNMTAIIVKFSDLGKRQGTKRQAEPSDQSQEEVLNNKKVKIDESED